VPGNTATKTKACVWLAGRSGSWFLLHVSSHNIIRLFSSPTLAIHIWSGSFPLTLAARLGLTRTLAGYICMYVWGPCRYVDGVQEIT
jgi:hypothetical protein